LSVEAHSHESARDGDRDNLARDLSDDLTHDHDRAACIVLGSFFESIDARA
jgi:hypothetical protein